MTQHLEDNQVDMRYATLLEAAVAAEDGAVWFEVGAAADWYGQQVVDPPATSDRRGREMVRRLFPRRHDATEARAVRQVPAVSVRSVLEEFQRVDLIDLDIQGAEAAVLESAADVLAAKVKRVCVGTHGHDNEARVRKLFGGLGWRCDYDYPGNGVADTPWGRILFEDGVQIWVDPRL